MKYLLCLIISFLTLGLFSQPFVVEPLDSVLYWHELNQAKDQVISTSYIIRKAQDEIGTLQYYFDEANPKPYGKELVNIKNLNYLIEKGAKHQERWQSDSLDKKYFIYLRAQYYIYGTLDYNAAIKDLEYLASSTNKKTNNGVIYFGVSYKEIQLKKMQEIYYYQKKYQKALEVNEQYLSHEKKGNFNHFYYARDHKFNSEAINFRLKILNKTNKHQKVLNFYKELLESVKNIRHNTYYTSLFKKEIFYRLQNIYLEKGDFSKALTYNDSILELSLENNSNEIYYTKNKKIYSETIKDRVFLLKEMNDIASLKKFYSELLEGAQKELEKLNKEEEKFSNKKKRTPYRVTNSKKMINEFIDVISEEIQKVDK